MAAVIGALRAVMSLDSAAFQKGITSAQKSLRGMQKSLDRSAAKMRKAGKKLSVGLTAPLAGSATIAVKSSLATVDAQAKMAQSLDTTTKSIQVLTRAGDLAGVSMGQIEQGLIAMTKRLSQAAAGGGPAADALDRLKLSAEELQSLPADERIAKIQTAISELIPASEQAAVASQIFGDRAAIAFSRIDAATIGQATQELERFGVVVSDTDADQIERTNDAISALGLVTRGLANQLAVALAPVLEDLAKKIQGVGAWFTGLSDETKRFIVIAGGIASALGPALIAFGLMASGVSAIVGAVATVAPAIAGLAAAIASPVAAVVAVVAAIGYAAYEIWENWDVIGPKLTELWQRLKEVATETWGAIKSFFLDGWDAITEAVVTAWENISQAFRDGAQMVVTALQNVWQAIVAEVSQWPGRFLEFGQQIMQGLVDGIMAKWESVKATISGIGANIKSTFTGLLGIQSPSKVFREYGGYLMEGLAQGIAQKGALAVDATRAVGEEISDVGEQSSQVGSMFASTFSSVITGAQSAQKAVAQLAQQLADMLLQKAFMQLLGPVFSAVPVFADGAAFSGGRVVPFASGGVVSAPTMFPMAGGAGLMGEAGPEAIMPLTRIGGKLGVTAQAAAPEVSNKIVNVLDPGLVGDYLATPAGENMVLNVIRSNRDAL